MTSTSGSVATTDAREAGRGSSAIFDAADLVLHMTYVAGEPLRIQQTKARFPRELLTAGVARHELHHETATTPRVDFHSTRGA